MKPDEPDPGETGTFARRFASRILAELDDDAADPRTARLPESPDRGVEPVVQRCINASDEAGAAARWLGERHRAGDAWRDLVVLAPGKRNWRDPIAKALTREGIPHRMLLGDKTLVPDFTGDQVHVMTLHDLKALEPPGVAVLGIGDLPWKTQTLEEAARLLHVAMTRATRALLILHSKPSALVERLLSS